jgi:hypothetical protein
MCGRQVMRSANLLRVDCLEFDYACVSVSSSNIMDEASCSICQEPFVGFRQCAKWFWPCGHGVHARCLTVSHAALRSVDGPCFTCRQAACPGARSNFELTFPELIQEVPAEAPSHEAPPAEVPAEAPAHAVRITNVVALCCPRLLFANGIFVEQPCDRRMEYMGLDGNGSENWTCLRCDAGIALDVLPTSDPVCPEHGRMCYVMDRRMLDGAPFWSCCDRRDSRNPFPLSHLRNLVGYGLPITVISESSEDEMSFGTRSQTSEQNEDAAMDDDHFDIAGANHLHHELASLRHIRDTWDTTEQVNALTAMLNNYD